MCRLTDSRRMPISVVGHGGGLYSILTATTDRASGVVDRSERRRCWRILQNSSPIRQDSGRLRDVGLLLARPSMLVLIPVDLGREIRASPRIEIAGQARPEPRAARRDQLQSLIATCESSRRINGHRIKKHRQAVKPTISHESHPLGRSPELSDHLEIHTVYVSILSMPPDKKTASHSLELFNVCH